jgi:hypothetical protein
LLSSKKTKFCQEIVLQVYKLCIEGTGKVIPVPKHHITEAYMWSGDKLQVPLDLALDEGGQSASCSSRLTVEEITSAPHCMSDQVSFRSVLDVAGRRQMSVLLEI